MNQQNKEDLLASAKEFFRINIAQTHLNNALSNAANINSYNLNPFLVKYLANFLRGNDSPRSIAEALVLPRVLGTSINTTFGVNIQKMISHIFEGIGSTTHGIDIEFIDQLDNRRKYCQLKSGPNTINRDDVETIFGHFTSITRLARTNNLDINVHDLTVGVVYGEQNELSSHYNSINNRYPVYIGREFWHRLTGFEDFYRDLIDTFGEVAIDVDGSQVINDIIDQLAQQISEHFS